MANEKDVRELLSLQQEIEGVASEMSSFMTDDASTFTFKKSAVYFAAEDSCNTEMEKFEQALKQALPPGSSPPCPTGQGPRFPTPLRTSSHVIFRSCCPVPTRQTRAFYTCRACRPLQSLQFIGGI
jgi:hypothetical protein